MGFPGTWMTESESVVYRLVPKCACSTIGQIMYYSDHGAFFDGDIHNAESGLHKWGFDASKVVISENVLNHNSYTFTCVRNPYTRILSSFFDKICGIQSNGKRYRGNQLAELIHKYGIEVGGDDGKQEFDQITSFRRFLLFARDTILWNDPIRRDLHWSPVSHHVGKFVEQGGTYDKIIWTEKFNEGMQGVLNTIDTKHTLKLANLPRFNESGGHGPKRAHPVEDYFDDMSQHLVHEIFEQDFNLFKYDYENPSNKVPIGEIDLDEVHASLRSPKTVFNRNSKATSIKDSSTHHATAVNAAEEVVPPVSGGEIKKKEFLEQAVKRSGVNVKDAKLAIEVALALLSETLLDGMEVNLPPLGKLKVERRKDLPNATVLDLKLRISNRMRAVATNASDVVD